jgi:hypothetical protein
MGSRRDEVNDLFSIYLILPAALGPGVYSVSNRSEYQKQKNNASRDQSAAVVRRIHIGPPKQQKDDYERLFHML